MFALLKSVFYIPLYNALILLIGRMPGFGAGGAVILLTLAIKIILFPLSQRASKFQFEMKAHEAELNRIKERFKGNREEQGRAILAFYKEKGINPFMGILPVLIQIPIVIGLYYVFYKGGLPGVNEELLYSFVPVPPVDMHFFGIDISEKSILLAVLTGASQFLQGHFASPPPPAPSSGKPSFQEDLARGMRLQVKYVLPLIMAFVAYQVSGAVALYFITSNLFTVCQELYLRKKFKKEGHLTHRGASD
ncbi:MAG: YidC/Oxa1 family membrane protein insertase [bacterium]|nr:YidC/Oxa1 family membrane protein insertase [bacterium]